MSPKYGLDSRIRGPSPKKLVGGQIGDNMGNKSHKSYNGQLCSWDSQKGIIE